MDSTKSKKCVCDVCGAVTHSIPDTKHRRCGGHAGADLRKKTPLVVTLREPALTSHRPKAPRTRSEGFFYIVNNGGSSLSGGPGQNPRAGTWRAA